MAQTTVRLSPVRYRAPQIFIENPLACKDDFEDDLSIVKMDLTNSQCNDTALIWVQCALTDAGLTDK